MGEIVVGGIHFFGSGNDGALGLIVQGQRATGQGLQIGPLGRKRHGGR